MATKTTDWSVRNAVMLVDACRESLDAVGVQCGPSSLVDGWKVQLRPVANSSNDSNHDNIVTMATVVRWDC